MGLTILAWSHSVGFTLEFGNKNLGDPVEVIVKREGYVPVNEVQLELERWNIPTHRTGREGSRANHIDRRKGPVSTNQWLNGPKWRGQTAKAQFSASEHAILNGGFRADVVSTRESAPVILILIDTGIREASNWRVARRSSTEGIDPLAPGAAANPAPNASTTNHPTTSGGCQ